jgi:hypothetical protein
MDVEPPIERVFQHKGVNTIRVLLQYYDVEQLLS